MDSALAQTLEEKEVILVDDGSPDACPQICDRLCRPISRGGAGAPPGEPGPGHGPQRRGRLARGEYIAFMDSDDTIEPEMLSALYEKAKEGDFDWVMCDVRIRYVEEGR